jgi:hypothetical protein
MAGNIMSDNGLTTRKTSKAKTSKTGGKTATRKKTAPTVSTAANEILYDQTPNPYHPPAPPYLWIDYPFENETLGGPMYVVRLGVGGAEQVELSINNGDWQPCRFTSGYWWYDWSAIAPASYTLVARMKTSSGQWYRTPPRSCRRS